MANSTEYNVLLKIQSQVDKGLSNVVKELKNLTNELSNSLKNVNAASKSASSGLKSAKTDTEGLSKVTVALQKDLKSAATKSDQLTTSLKRAAEQSNEDVKMYNAVAKALKGAEGHSDRFSAAILRAQEASKGNVSVFNQLHSALQKVEKAILAEATAFQTGSQAQKDFITVHNRLGAAQKLLAGETVKVGNAFYEMNSKGTTTRLTLEQLEARAKKLEAENLKLQQGLKNTGTSLKEAAAQGNVFDRAIYKISQSFQTLLSYFTAGASIYTFISGIKSAVGEIVNFDQALKNIQAVTGATEVEMGRMRDVILDVAATTKFSTTEVAEGVTILGQAGFSATESMQAIESVANLATATLSDFKDTADLVTTAIRAFHLEATDAAEVTDIFASAINNSKLTLDKIRTAMNYLGPVAEASNLSLQESTAVLGELANSGIRASTMGTGFRQVLSRLMNPTAGFAEAIKELGGDMEKLNPMTNDLRTIIDELSNTVTDAGAAFELFGLRGAPIVSALAREGVAGFDAMMIAVSETGTAAEMASKQLEGLGLKAKQIADKVKTLVVMFSEESGLTGAIRTALTAVQDILDKLIEFADSGVGKTVTAMAGAVIGVGALVTALVVLKGVITALAVRLLPSVAAGITGVGTAAGTAGAAASVTTLSGAVGGLSKAVLGVSGGIAAFNPLVLVLISSLGILAAAFAYTGSKIDEKVKSLSSSSDAVNEARQVIGEYINDLKNQNKTIENSRRVLEGSGNSVYEYKQALTAVAKETGVLDAEQVKNMQTMTEMQKAYYLNRDALLELQKANEKVIATQDLANIAHAVTEYKRLAEEINNTEQRLQELKSSMSTIAKEAVESKEPLNLLGETFKFVANQTNFLREKIDLLWGIFWDNKEIEETTKKLEEMKERMDSLAAEINTLVREWANMTDEMKSQMLARVGFSEKEIKEIIANEKILTDATLEEIIKRSGLKERAATENLQVLKDFLHEQRTSEKALTDDLKEEMEQRKQDYIKSKEGYVDALADAIEEEKITVEQAQREIAQYYRDMESEVHEVYQNKLKNLESMLAIGKLEYYEYVARKIAFEREWLEATKSIQDEHKEAMLEDLKTIEDALNSLNTKKEESEKEDSTSSTKSDATGSTASGSTASKKADESSKKVAASYGKAATAVKEVEKNVSSASTTTSKWSDNINEAGRHIRKSGAAFTTVKKEASDAAYSTKEVASSSKESSKASKEAANSTREQGEALSQVVAIQKENGEITLVQVERTKEESLAIQEVAKSYEIVSEKTKDGIVLKQQSVEKTKEEEKGVKKVVKEVQNVGKELEKIAKRKDKVVVEAQMKVDGSTGTFSAGVSKINSMLDKITKEIKTTVTVEVKKVESGSSGGGSTGDGDGGGGGGGHRLGGLVSASSGFFKGMIKNFTKFARGGRIPGFGGGDRIPILAEAGEYVVNKFATSKNKALLDAINYQQANLSDFVSTAKGEMKGFQSGGAVGSGDVEIHRHVFTRSDGTEESFDIVGTSNNDKFAEFAEMMRKGNLTRRTR